MRKLDKWFPPPVLEDRVGLLEGRDLLVALRDPLGVGLLVGALF